MMITARRYRTRDARRHSGAGGCPQAGPYFKKYVRTYNACCPPENLSWMKPHGPFNVHADLLPMSRRLTLAIHIRWPHALSSVRLERMRNKRTNLSTINKDLILKQFSTTMLTWRRKRSSGYHYNMNHMINSCTHKVRTLESTEVQESLHIFSPQFGNVYVKL